jgi:peptidoglycan/LPS O-acetylase OafA/YrhL
VNSHTAKPGNVSGMSTKLETPALLSARTDRSARQAIRRFRPDIEGLRAVAVTVVVLSHLHLGFPGGYVGVDVFFVISGFLITRQLMGEFERIGKISFRGFYARRVRRILPAATVVIVGTILASLAWDSPLQVNADALDGFFSALSGINWRLAASATNYFQASAPPSPFQHFWSLAVEEQFYAVWPILLLAIGVVAGRKYGRRTSVIWALLLIMAGSLTLSITTTRSSPSWAYFGTQTRAWELAFGALLAVTVDVWTRMPPALASQMSWLGLGLIALSVFIYGATTNYPGAAVILPVVGSVFVIAGGCPGWSRSAELVLRWRPMQFLGKTSYSWYLVHWPVLTILPLALGHDLTTSDKWLALAGSLALATIMFYVVEQPVRIRPWLVRKPRRSLVLGSVLVLCSLAAATLVPYQVSIPGGGGGTSQVATGPLNLTTVKDLVAAGARLTRLPSNVTPSLTAAVTDRPFTTNACLVPDAPTTPVPDKRCTFGDLHARRTMAVVGDSHANAWMPAIASFGKADRWKIILYAKAGCPPGVYPDDISPVTNRLYVQCNEWRSRIFSRLRALKPNVILVTSELRTLDIDTTGMVEAIHNYAATGARVIYLEDSPSPEKDISVPDCLARHADDIQQCSLRTKDPTTRLSAFIPRRAESAAARSAGATVLNPTAWFCTAWICPTVINNMIVYADGSHTTATYVSWLAPVMSAVLKKAVS